MIRFEWDDEKARINWNKRHISFEEATEVFDDPLAVVLPDPYEYEQRWRIVGRTTTHLILLLVVHTSREDDDTEIIRIISARPLEPHERSLYEHGKL